MTTPEQLPQRIALMLDYIERLADDHTPDGYPAVQRKTLDECASIISQQGTQVEQLTRERDDLAAKLKDSQELAEYIKERRAQISHRLWVWAHEELSEPLKTRYFNIVANGTADVMEQPTYAQQYNNQKHRADTAEAERDSLRAELAALREQGQWRPIETAPKDGASVWVTRAGNPYPSAAFFSHGHWHWSTSGAYAGNPTHWLPLPPSPTSAEGA